MWPSLHQGIYDLVKETMPIVAYFRSLINPEEVNYLRGRGAERPEDHLDGFRLVGTLYKLPEITCFEKHAKLIFCGPKVRRIETLASVADGSAAFLLWEAVPRLFAQAMAEGASV